MIAIYAFIGDRDLVSANRFLDLYADSLSVIAEHPDIGSTRLWTHPALVGVRAWPVKRYEQFVIYYRRQNRAIRVLRVLRGSVPPEAMLRTPD